jgi:hypothetical protein
MTGDVFLHHHVQTGTGAAHPKGTGSSFLGIKWLEREADKYSI